MSMCSVLLLCVCGTAALVAPRPLHPSSLASMPVARRAGSLFCMQDGEASVLQQMSATFWQAKRAQLRAESEARLREMDEFIAREQALASTVLSGAAGAAVLASPAELTQVKLELAQEKAKVEQLQAALAQQALDAELALQKSTAYWVAKVSETRAALPAAAAASAVGGVAPPTASRAAAGPELVPQDQPLVREDMTLRELRAHLLSYGLSTLGLKSELRARLQQAMLDDRQQHKSWDPSTLSWVVSSA
eukprot:scaffold14068_cov119-Isochrysis_galbana.AAC.6